MVSADDGSAQASFAENNQPPKQSLDTTTVAVLYEAHAAELRRFLMAVCRDSTIAADVLQAAFVKLVEQGGGVRQDARKAWLFQVAYRLALAMRRREGVGQRVLESLAWLRADDSMVVPDAVAQRELMDRVRQAVNLLPAEQRIVVRLRIDEEKTFAEIARELRIPLGTALSRMHSALNKLRESLGMSE